MKDTDVITSLNNAWRALAKIYYNGPNEEMRHAMNLLAKIIGEVESEGKKSHEEKQITVDEWIALLKSGS